MDWGRSQVHIRCTDGAGHDGWVVRVPCFLSAAQDPRDDGRCVLAFREKIYGRAVSIVCRPENMPCYADFIGKVVDAGREDASVYEPSGELYVAVVGMFLGADSGSILVRTDVPGGCFMMDYAHGGQDGEYRLYGRE